MQSAAAAIQERDDGSWVSVGKTALALGTVGFGNIWKAEPTGFPGLLLRDTDRDIGSVFSLQALEHRRSAEMRKSEIRCFR